MVALWSCGRPAVRREIAARLSESCRWADTTLLNFLLRLENKHFVSVQRQGNKNVYTPLVRRETYCGAVSAGCGGGAGIAWLYGREKEPQALLKDVSHTSVNALAVDSGIVCDGAKASCAAKIATALDCALMAHHMSMDGQTFLSGEGLVKPDIEATIASVGRMGRVGMHPTDVEILHIMMEA